MEPFELRVPLILQLLLHDPPLGHFSVWIFVLGTSYKYKQSSPLVIPLATMLSPASHHAAPTFISRICGVGSQNFLRDFASFVVLDGMLVLKVFRWFFTVFSRGNQFGAQV